MIPPKAAVLFSFVVPVLPPMSWPGMIARRPVPAGETTPTIMLASVFATPAGIAFWLQ